MTVLEMHLSNDLPCICSELQNKGIVFEGDFLVLDGNTCKSKTIAMTEIFSRETGLDIWYTFENPYFAFYDTDRFTEDDVKKKIRNKP